MKRILSLLACSVLVIGCGKGGFSKRSQPGSSNAYRYALANLTTFDPGKVQDVDTIDLLAHVYEGLVSYDENNRVAPQVAESWTVQNGGKTYVFKIRKDATFHSGATVTAKDFKWTFERNLNPKFGSQTASNYLSDIVGVSDFLTGKTSSVSGIKVVDDKTLQITIDQPRAYFLGKLTYPCAWVVEKGSVTGSEIDDPLKCSGTGPFKVGQYAPEQMVVLAANQSYYLGKAGVDLIVRTIVKDAPTRLNKYRNGELDTVSLERQDIPNIQADPKLKDQLRLQPRPAVNYLTMSPDAYPPFKDKRVRRALTMAIDRERICGDVLGNVPIAKSLLPPGILGYRDNNPSALPFDPAAAKRELAAAGYPSGKGMPPLTLALRAQTSSARLLAEAVASDINKNLGITVKLREMEWRSLLDARSSKKLAFVVSSWYADYLDPENFLSFLLMSGSPQNYESYSNPEFDKLCMAADTEIDEAKRAALYGKAEDIVLRDAVRIPIYYAQDASLYSPRVSGVRFNLFGSLPNRTVVIKQN